MSFMLVRLHPFVHCCSLADASVAFVNFMFMLAMQAGHPCIAVYVFLHYMHSSLTSSIIVHDHAHVTDLACVHNCLLTG